MQFNRIRWRLTAWNLVVLGLVLVVTLGTIAFSAIKARSDATERELRLGASREVALFSTDHDDDGRGRDAYLPEAPGLFAFSVDRAGQSVGVAPSVGITGLPDAQGIAAALRGTESLQDRTLGGVPVRLLSVPVYHEGRIEGAVQVGKALTADQRELTNLFLILALTGGAALALAAVGSLFLAGRAMQPVQEAFERQRQFIADASHELRTPVAVIRARAETIQREAGMLPADAAVEVQRLGSDAEELSRLLDELLDLARLDAGQAPLPLEPVALEEVAEEIVAQLKPIADRHAIQFDTTTEPVWGVANLGRLRQVLRALAANALAHTPSGGHVSLSIGHDRHWARIAVHDTGEGIAPEHLPHVFDRFYRADAARVRSDDSGGTGLGLAIAAQLVRLMHGRVRLDSTVGAGTTATVLLPLASHAS